jgi:diguanylate cyclase (GGDEF)-like protein/PAS domain S-box-containing protein
MASESSYLQQDEAYRLKTILDGTGAGTWEWNIQTGETIFNQRWAEMIGYSLEELQPTSIETWIGFTHPDDLALSEQRLKEHFRGDTDCYQCEARMRHRDGHWVWVRDYGRLVSRTPEGEPEWISGTHIEISSSKQYEQQLELIRAEQQQTIQRFEKMASLLPGVVYQFELRPDGTMTFPYASAGIERVYGVTPEQAQKDGSIVFEAIHPDDRDHVAQTISLSRSRGENWICEYRVVKDGVTNWVLGRAQPEFKPDGTIIWHGAILDITSQKTLEEELRQTSTTDDLTGAANRRRFTEVLSWEFERLKRNGAGYAVVLFDFDWFKRVNDHYGHHVGDLVLRETAHRIRNELRTGDTLGRIGGEEFAVLLPQCDENSARQFAERLRRSVEQLRFIGFDELRGTITCGVAISDRTDEKPSQILVRADQAMYRGKAQGRNQVVVFDYKDQDSG